MATKKDEGAEIPRPPIPKSLLPETDSQFEKPVALKPDDTRARLQLLAGISLDVMEWHARNLSDPKMSQEACKDLLDRAGFVAPAKTKADGMLPSVGGGEALPAIEDQVKGMSDAFNRMRHEPEDSA